MKKTIFILFINIFFSCQTKEEQLIGHWHEYKKGNPDFLSCHKITNSTYEFNSFGFGRNIPLKRGIAIQKNEIIGDNLDSYVTSNFTIINNKVIANDSVYWIKQENNEQTYISDFSAGLSVNIHPFETKTCEFDYKKKKGIYEVYIYVGKLKKSILEKSKEYNAEKYYIQLNDKVSNLDDIRSFLITESYTVNEDIKGKVMLNLDKNVPLDFISKLEAEILNCGFQKDDIYYLTTNLEKRCNGYNHRN